MSDDVQNLTPKKRPRWVKAFLAALAESGNVRFACEAADVSRATVYALRSADEAFAAEWAQAQEEAADLLELEARRRAYEGLRRVKFDRGRPIMVPAIGADGLAMRNDAGEIEMIPYVEHEYSDTLMIFLLKGARPEVYRDRTEVRHSGGIDVSGADREQAEKELNEWREQMSKQLSGLNAPLTPPTPAITTE